VTLRVQANSCLFWVRLDGNSLAYPVGMNALQAFGLLHWLVGVLVDEALVDEALVDEALVDEALQDAALALAGLAAKMIIPSRAFMAKTSPWTKARRTGASAALSLSWSILCFFSLDFNFLPTYSGFSIRT